MLLVLRKLRSRLSLPLAALFAFSVLGAEAEAQLPEPAHGDPTHSEPAHPESHGGLEAEAEHAALHLSDAHSGPVGDSAGHGSDQDDPGHGSEHDHQDPGSEHDHSHHGCNGCTCVAAAGCSGPALSPTTVSPSGFLETSSSVIRGSVSFALNSLGHDIFRPPRS